MLYTIFVSLALIYLLLWGATLLLKRRRAAHWEIAEGVIETFRCERQGRTLSYVADIGYSFSARDSYFSGVVSTPADWWQRQPSSDLIGAKIHVRVNPRNPDDSVLISASLPGINQSRAPQFLVNGANR